MGVEGLTNTIKIKSEKHDAIEMNDIEDALGTILLGDDKNIEMLVSGTTVTSIGMANPWYQKEAAGHTAWKISSTWHVENMLTID